MDGKVPYASDSCLAESPAGGRINSLGVSHCTMGTVPLLYRVTQAASRLAKTPKTQRPKRNGWSGSAERVAPAIPLSHVPSRCSLFPRVTHCFPGAAGFQVGH